MGGTRGGKEEIRPISKSVEKRKREGAEIVPGVGQKWCRKQGKPSIYGSRTRAQTPSKLGRPGVRPLGKKSTPGWRTTRGFQRGKPRVDRGRITRVKMGEGTQRGSRGFTRPK